MSLKSINTILDAIEPEKKLLYDKDYIETLYRRYQSTECNDEADIQALSASWSERPLLLLGPGKNLELEKEAILSYIKAHNPITISVNFIPEGIPIDYAFLSNSRRYVQLNNRLLEHADAQGSLTAGSGIVIIDRLIDPGDILIQLVDELTGVTG